MRISDWSSDVCSSDLGLQRHGLAAAQALVGGDDQLRLAVAHAVGDGVGGEAAEHHRVDRADARAGQHRHGGVDYHRQVDGDAVALRSEEHTSEIQSLMRTSYAVFCLKNKQQLQ